MGDLEKLEEMLGHRKGYGQNNSKNRDSKPERTNRKDYLNSKLQEDSWNKSHWDDLSNADKRQARKVYTFDNEDERNLGDNIRFRAQGTKFSESGRYKNVKQKNVKQFGGPLPKAQVGDAGQFQGSNSFGNSFGNGFGQNTSSSNSFSMNNTLPNPFIQGADYTNPFTGKRPGVTVGPNGNYIDNQKQNKNPFDFTTPGGTEDQGNEYVGIERKRKNALKIDGEGAVNAFNAAGHGVLGIIDRRRNNVIENNMLLDMSDPMNSVTASNQTDRGDWGDIGSKTGMFRYDEMGSDRNSRATYGNYANTNARYGGYMQNGGYMDDEEMYMTPEELEQFLAAGGQVEYL